MRNAIFLALALGLVACGSNDDTPAPSNTGPSISAPAGDAPAAAEGAEDKPAGEAGPDEGGEAAAGEGAGGDAVEAEDWAIDQKLVTHQVRTSGSSISFVSTKNTDAEVPGSFTNLGGLAILDWTDLNKTQASITVDLTAVESGDEARDNNLKTVFFDAMRPDSAAGSVDLTALTAEPKTLAAGERGSGKATVNISIGRTRIKKTIDVELERSDDTTLVASFDKIPLSIADLGFEDKKAALIKVCGHTALADLVTAGGRIVLELPPKK